MRFIHQKQRDACSHVSLLISLVLLTASSKAKFVIHDTRPLSSWITVRGITGGASNDGPLPDAVSDNDGNFEHGGNVVGDEGEGDGEKDEEASGASDPRAKFKRAASSLRANGHPADCTALKAFEAAIDDEASREEDILERWLDVRVAMCAPTKGNTTIYEKSLHMVVMEATAYEQGNKVSRKVLERLTARLAMELGVGEATFLASFAEFEKNTEKEVGDVGQKLYDRAIALLRDPEFAEKAQKSMDERQSRAREFLSSVEMIEKTRLEFLEALEGASTQGKLAAIQMAIKLKPTLEVLLGDNAFV